MSNKFETIVCNQKMVTFVKEIFDMGTKDKLIVRFKNMPVDFTWDELVRLFGIFGYSLDNKGKTSGSRVIFANGEKSYVAHKPHPGSIVKKYVMRQVFQFFDEQGLL